MTPTRSSEPPPTDPRRGGVAAADVGAAWRALGEDEPLDVVVHRSVTSTNDVVAEDPRPWRVVVAEHQSAGRGRRGRSWESPAGAGLAMTVVLPAPADDAEGGTRVGWYPLVAGLALADAVLDVTGVPARLKWPNDLLLPTPDAGTGPWAGWGKAAGILAERPHRSPVVVLGAGVNVDHAAGELPAGVSLAGVGAAITADTRAALVAGYVSRLFGLTRGVLAEGVTDTLRAAYAARCHTVGLAVMVHLPGGGRLTGSAVGVNAAGALLVRDAEGAEHEVHAGDVEHVRPAPPGSGTLPS